MTDTPNSVNPQLASALAKPANIMRQWMDAYEGSVLRLPNTVDRDVMSSMAESIIHALTNVVAPDRAGRILENLRFVPGADELREVEKAVSFVASRLGTAGFTGFDVGALIFALRDVLSVHVCGDEELEMRSYMEWLAVLAANSLAKGREHAAIERWHNELDEGTPLVMITSELPAVMLVCRPDRRVSAGVLGRLLLTVVRTGAKAAIIDVSGVSGGLNDALSDSLERFLGHSKVKGSVTVFATGVHNSDVSSWERIVERSGATVVFEDYFDAAVSGGLELGGWRLLRSS